LHWLPLSTPITDLPSRSMRGMVRRSTPARITDDRFFSVRVRIAVQ